MIELKQTSSGDHQEKEVKFEDVKSFLHNIFLISFSDLTEAASWERAKFWVDEIRKNEEVTLFLDIPL